MDTAIETRREGPTVTLTCTKQKDMAPFDPIRLHLQPVDESVALYSHEGMRATEELTPAETTLYEAVLGACESDGLPASTLLKISGLPDSSFYRARNLLLSRGAIRNVGTKTRPRYTTPARTQPEDSQ